MRRAILVTALFASGCGSLDTADQVHDLRMLAIRSDPAEQIFQLPIYADGGAADGGVSLQSALVQAALSLQPITVTALVADPKGMGRSIHYDFVTCAELNDAGRCDESGPDTQMLVESDAAPDAGWIELSTTFTPSPQILYGAIQDDAYHGFDFLPVPVQLHITAGDEEVYGFKRLVFSFQYLGEPQQVANENPYIPLLQRDGVIWAANDVDTLVDRRDYDLTPVIPDGGEVEYERPTFEGTFVSFAEDWRYNFFATAGTFSSFGTGGSNTLIGSQNPVDSTWTPKDTDGAQDVTFFVVVRDGRGGEGWTIRTAHFQPTVPAKQ